MQLRQDNWRDIQRYYEGTYVKFKEFGETLHLINKVAPDGITGVDETGTDFIVRLWDEQEYSLDYILPHKSVFQYGGDAYLLQRIPARQYKRGLCADNTTITKISNGERQSVSWSLLKAFTNKQKFFSLKEAIFGKGKLRTLALNNRMSYNKSHGYIYVDGKVIATVSPETKTITTIPLFHEDIRDLISQDFFEVKLV